MVSDIIKNTLFIGYGSFIGGAARYLVSIAMKTVGICGGFTTFSTFSKEALMMLQAGNFMSLLAYVAISVIAGIALVAAGYYLVRI